MYFIPFFNKRVLFYTSYYASELEEINNRKVTYNDEQIPLYDATQSQRQMEADIRDMRRQLVGLNELPNSPQAKADFTKYSVKLKDKEAQYKDFSKQTGLPTQNERMRVYEYNKSLSQKVVWENKKALKSKQEADIIKALKSTRGIQGDVHLTPRVIKDIKSYSFDSKHIASERSRDITKETALKWIAEARVSTTVWNEQYERYYADSGSVYVDVWNKNIRTAYAEKDYSEAVKTMMEVLK